MTTGDLQSRLGLPRPVVRYVRGLYLGLLDAADRLAGRADDLTPPRSLHFVGGGDFRAVGAAYLGHFRNIGGLKPDESLLDIGCGTGRMAVPLLGYLSESGRYVGFDISQPAIEWCQLHIARRNSRFEFAHADIFNLEYNSRGTLRAAAYRFPCDDASVDFAFATSVFTHIHGDEVRNYLRELHRVLVPGGRALLTFFISDGPAVAAPGNAVMQFRHAVGEGFTIDPRTPERAIAYPETFIRETARQADLEIVDPIRYGRWSGRPDGVDLQDIVLLRRSHEHA